ncbi:MAG TPA: PIN domain-containing protein [Solirubrobacteraceae bacterium]|nr:PIN domain-containing protein [Solirubrobacteraceae bacterium]
MPLLLDTTVLIDVLRDLPVADRLRQLRGADRVPWICAVNVDEVLRGAHVEEETRAVRFLRGLQMAPLGRAEGERAGRWRRDFARRGVTLSQADCLIAAAAAGVDARLVTGNPKHFPMPELTIEHWPVGE